MRFRRLKKHEKQRSWHAITSILADEALSTLPSSAGPVRYRDGLTPGQIQEGEQEEQAARAQYEEVYQEVRRDVALGAFQSFCRYLPFYGLTLLRDLLNAPECFRELEDLRQVAQWGDRDAQDLLEHAFRGLWLSSISGRPPADSRITSAESKALTRLKNRFQELSQTGRPQKDAMEIVKMGYAEKGSKNLQRKRRVWQRFLQWLKSPLNMKSLFRKAA